MHSAVVVAAKFCELAEEEARKSGKANDMTAGKLLKMVYIAHGFKLALTDKPLISATIEAWNHGPVIPELYRRIRTNHNAGEVVSKLDGVTQDDLSSLSKAELDSIYGTFKTYNKYTAADLSRITHDPAYPWYKIKNLAKLDSTLITDEDTKVYYLDLICRLSTSGGPNKH